MADKPNLQEDVKHWKEIEVFLVKKRCANVHEIAKNIDAHWLTTQKELQLLENLGRVHKEQGMYFLNGVGQWQKRIDLAENHSLFIDTFRSPFGDNFIRIKETKKNDGSWETLGNIMITRDKISQVKDFLSIVEENLKTVHR